MDESESAPDGVVSLDVPAGGRGGVERLRTLLLCFDLPAVIVQDPFGAGDRITAVLICDETRAPLSAVVVGGALRWELCASMPFARAVSDRFGSDVYLDGGWLGADEAETDAEPEAEAEPDADLEPERPALGRFAWMTKERRDILPVIARAAGQPLGVLDVDGRRLVIPTSSPDLVRSSGVWMVGSGLLMWRDGDRRGIASFQRNSLLHHSFDDEPESVDPTRGWECDDHGNTVTDYLRHLAPVESDAHEWAGRFRLDAERSEGLRVLLRRRGSTGETLSQAAAILGVSPLLADVAEGRVDPVTRPGYEVIRPATVLQTIRADLAEELTDAHGGPFFAWYRFSARHPRWRAVITTLAIVLLAVMLVLKIGRDDTGTLWLPIVGLVLWGIDIVTPRSRYRPTSDTP